MYIPIVVLDFDGVIHSYKSGWKGAAVSARSATTEGQTAIRDWLKKYNIPVVEIMAEKPPALVYADDRAICFDGDAATLYEKIERFKPWYKKEV